jgi:hypothetical protein
MATEGHICMVEREGHQKQNQSRDGKRSLVKIRAEMERLAREGCNKRPRYTGGMSGP